MSLDNIFIKPGVSGFDGHVTFRAIVMPEKEWKPQNDFLSLTGLQNFRIKIRIIGLDSPNKEVQPDSETRWAIVSSPAHLGGGAKGLGETLVLSGGETVCGYFLDGEDGQQAVVTNLLNCSFKDVKNHLDSPNAFASTFETDGLKEHLYNYEQFKIENPTANYWFGGEQSNAAIGFIDATNIKIGSFSICGTDTVSKTKEVLSDFIKNMRTYQKFGSDIIDPVTNEIINMQNDIEVIKGQVSGILKGTINVVRKKIIKKINDELKKKATKKKTTSEGINEAQNNKDKQSDNVIAGLIGCLFKGVLDGIGGFLTNMLNNLLSNVLNGALCAIEQFISGIFAKVFDSIEKGLASLMSGLSGLTGILSSVTGLLGKAGSFASGILEFLDKCLPEEEKCVSLDSKIWTSSTNSSKKVKKDNWEDQVKNINVFKGISKGLTNLQNDIVKGSQDVQNLDYNGVPLQTTVNATSILTGGSSNALLDKGLGSIESAITQSSLFGLGNNRFDACNQKVSNPTSQEDITPMRPGYIYPVCIPPIAEVSGSGSGAELLVIVGNDRRIFSIEVINGGSGYDQHAGISIIDNTGNGTGAYARAVVNDGVITQVVLMSTGYGYCLNTTDNESVGIGTNVVGVIEDVFVERPGYNYDPEDTVVVGEDNFPILTTPDGSIGKVTIPPNYNNEFSSPPIITMNTKTGVGVKLIPVMKFRGQLKTDANADKRKTTPLIGIDNVVDCIGDNRDPVGFVNGVEYSGPYHVMSSGKKMTGATHGVSDSIIYDTIEESLSNPVVSSSSYETPTEAVAETPVETTTTTTTNTTPTIVTTQTTPTTSMDTTTTSTPPSTSPPSTPPSSDPPSGGGGYGGY